MRHAVLTIIQSTSSPRASLNKICKVSLIQPLFLHHIACFLAIISLGSLAVCFQMELLHHPLHQMGALQPFWHFHASCNCPPLPPPSVLFQYFPHPQTILLKPGLTLFFLEKHCTEPSVRDDGPFPGGGSNGDCHPRTFLRLPLQSFTSSVFQLPSPPFYVASFFKKKLSYSTTISLY